MPSGVNNPEHNRLVTVAIVAAEMDESELVTLHEIEVNVKNPRLVI